MLRYLVRRILLTIPVLLGVATLVFSLIHLVPGDPAQAMLGDGASPQDIAELRASLGLDRPLLDQYVTFLRQAVTGDLGKSFRTGQPVTTMIVERLPATAELAIAAMIVAIVIAIPLGVIAAVWRGTAVDYGAMTFALAGVSIPNFWLGPLLAIVFAVELGWLPVSGRGTLAHLVLPAVSLGLALAAILARMTRASLLDELRELYVRAARARGVSRAVADCRPRTPEQHGAAADDHRAAVRRRADRRGDHRDDLRLARHRTIVDSVDRLPRLPDGAGLHPADRGDLRHGQSRHRSRCTACSIRGFGSNDPSTATSSSGQARAGFAIVALVVRRRARRAVAVAVGRGHAGSAEPLAGSDVAALVWTRRARDATFWRACCSARASRCWSASSSSACRRSSA